MTKRLLAAAVLLCLLGTSAYAQNLQQENRKNLVVRQWKTKPGQKARQLDHQTTYDSLGRKVEEVEYASYGQKSREVTEYVGRSNQVSREIVYDDKDKVRRIRKYEYNSDGSRKRQFSYKPDGKLASAKEYEYSHH